jgi:hypothetical protein
MRLFSLRECRWSSFLLVDKLSTILATFETNSTEARDRGLADCKASVQFVLDIQHQPKVSLVRSGLGNIHYC